MNRSKLGSVSIGSGPDPTISNSYLTLQVFPSGDPTLSNGSSSGYLLYPYDTSQISLYIDSNVYTSSGYLGGNLSSYMVISPTIVSANQILVGWLIGSISFNLTYTLMQDNLLINGTVVNKDVIAHNVGIRYLLDTEVGTDDGSPLFASGNGVKVYETDFPNPAFQTWQDYNVFPNPTFQGFATLITIPDRVAFVWWPSAKNSAWAYTPNPNQQFYTPGYTTTPQSDSAVLQYYGPSNISPNSKTSALVAYGLSLSIPAWKLAAIDRLNDIYSSLDSLFRLDMNSFASSIVDLDSLRLLTSPTWKDLYSIFGDPVGVISFIGTIVGTLKEYNSLSIIQNLNPDLISNIYPQFLQSTAYVTDSKEWDLLSKDMTYSGVDLAFAVAGILLTALENVMRAGADYVIKSNSALSSFFKAFDSSTQRDSNTILSLLGTYAGTNAALGSLLKARDAAVNMVQSFSPSPPIDTAYLTGFLADIDQESQQIHQYSRNIAVVGNNLFTFPNMTAILDTIDWLVNAVHIGNTVSETAGAIGTAEGLASIALAATGVGAPAAAFCAFVGLIASGVALLTQSLSMAGEFEVFVNEYQMTQSLIVVNASIPYFMDRVRGLVAGFLSTGSPVLTGGIVNVDVSNTFLSLGTAKFTVQVQNTASTDGYGYIVFHARSMSEQLTLADVEQVPVFVSAEGTNTVTFDSNVHFSWLGGDYEARIEFWLNQKMVGYEEISYTVGWGGGISNIVKSISSASISSGGALRYSYSSNPQSLRTIFTLGYLGSQIDLHLYDSQGRHVGVNYTTGQVEINVPDAIYSGQLANPQWISTPPGNYTVVVIGLTVNGTEPFTLNSLELLRHPPMLAVLPQSIYLILPLNATQVSFTIVLNEIGKTAAVTGLQINASNLGLSPKAGFQSSMITAPSSVQAGGIATATISYTMFGHLLRGNYTGKITISGANMNGSITIPVTIQSMSGSAVPTVPDPIAYYSVLIIVMIALVGSRRIRKVTSLKTHIARCRGIPLDRADL